MLTGIVLLVVAVTKFAEGAWIILALIPLHVLWFQGVHRHYGRVAAQLSLRDYEPERRRSNTVIIPIGGVHRAVLQALEYARSLSPDVRAVYVDVDPQATANVRRDWDRWGQGMPLVVLESPYRSLMEPLLEYIDQVDAERPHDYVTILLPEFVPARWWHHILHNQRALLIKGALLFRRNIVVTSVPFHLASWRYDTKIPLQTEAVRSIFLLDIRRDPRKRARQPGGTSQGAVLSGQAGRQEMWPRAESRQPSVRRAAGARALRVSSSEGEDTMANRTRIPAQTIPTTTSGATAACGGSRSPSTCPAGRRTASGCRSAPTT